MLCFDGGVIHGFATCLQEALVACQMKGISVAPFAIRLDLRVRIMDGVRTFFSRLGHRGMKASEIANHEGGESISGEDYAAHLVKLLAWERGRLEEDETLAFSRNSCLPAWPGNLLVQFGVLQLS
jgi:hypothetical protein